MLLSVNQLSVKRWIQMFSYKTVKHHLKQLIKKFSCGAAGMFPVSMFICPLRSSGGNMQGLVSAS